MGYKFYDILYDSTTRTRFIRDIESGVRKVIADNTVDVGDYPFKMFVIDSIKDTYGNYCLTESAKDTIITHFYVDEKEFNDHKEFFVTIIEQIDRIFNMYLMPELRKFPYRTMIVADFNEYGNPELSKGMKETFNNHINWILLDEYWRNVNERDSIY